ncbi:quinolinate synthase NadA [[Clostridium] spiroforme]|nr:quinolinate synthase NadA [Thomasclavelia spiroformis]MBM6880131.1 quinolinate synthase NadA [Thomasclavelia spiroformis]MBM6930397.1 quinolinate synthase NadA [Thomasclavelia spiroformis]
MNKKARIEKLKQEKEAIILAHFYVDEEVQNVADYIGDSFYLAKIAKETKAKIIVFAGVEFMGESAKILNPQKKVLLPDLHADCPMAHMVTIEEIEEMRRRYDDLAVVCYINSTAEIKTHADVCVTSANAVDIVKKLPQKNIFFIPDQNLGDFVRQQVPQKNIITNYGHCPRHTIITLQDVLQAQARYPQARLAVHPECTKDVLLQADYVGSTSGIINYVVNTPAQEFIIGTVDGVFAKIHALAPDKILHPVIENQICPNMKKVTLDKIIDVLENESNEVILEANFMDQAMKPLEKMLLLAK